MLKVVLDTSVISAAARSSKGASSKLIGVLAEGQFAAVLSPALLLEYEEVLRREQPPGGWSEADVAEFLDAICAVTEHCHSPRRVRPLLRDPDDDFVIELALAATVDYIVTHNVKDFENISTGVRVVTPGEFLRLLEGQS